MSAASIAILPPQKTPPLATCCPQLMPFNIDYNGIAPISTYFRVEPSKERVAAPEEPKGGNSTVDASPAAPSTNSEATGLLKEDIDVSTPGDPGAEVGTVLAPEVVEPTASASESTRFVSSFRGRAIHGLRVELPPGYSGLILRSAGEDLNEASSSVSTREAPTTEKVTAEHSSAKTTRRSTRHAQGAATAEPIRDADGDEVMADSTDAGSYGEEPPIRGLHPTAAFSAFMLWQPDNPVNEARDEYHRSLTEWVGLSSLINQVE
ncbi:hypothetical protein HGRIS_005234 [Hohenbuehelia grisea]|uniref:Uncharacterized protein n=1 Tax=Hohenbuehelia grisea TaxID=104357 RepID=A0ABR3JF92_9AGAR